MNAPDDNENPEDDQNELQLTEPRDFASPERDEASFLEEAKTLIIDPGNSIIEEGDDTDPFMTKIISDMPMMSSRNQEIPFRVPPSPSLDYWHYKKKQQDKEKVELHSFFQSLRDFTPNRSQLTAHMRIDKRCK